MDLESEGAYRFLKIKHCKRFLKSRYTVIHSEEDVGMAVSPSLEDLARNERVLFLHEIKYAHELWGQAFEPELSPDPSP